MTNIYCQFRASNYKIEFVSTDLYKIRIVLIRECASDMSWCTVS